MSHEVKHGKKILPHDLKYPLFLIGLVIMICGGLLGIKLGLVVYQEVVIAAVGFFVMFLGIVLE